MRLAAPGELRGEAPEAGDVLLQRAQEGAAWAVDGRYLVQAPIHRGGSDALWSAWDLQHGRLVALKLFHPSVWDRQAADQSAVLQHAARVAEVKHEAVLALERAGRCPHTGLVYLSLELCAEYREGLRQAARDVLATPSRDPHEAVRWVMQAAEGLEAAHAQGVTHNRLRLASILVRPASRRAQLTGFGPPPAAGAASESNHTEARPGAREDLQSLGHILYQLLTGDSERAANARTRSPRALARAIAQRWPGTPARHPRRLARIVRRTLLPDAQGYASCGALAADLRAYLGDHAPRAPARRRARALRTLFTGLVLLVCAGAVTWLLPRVWDSRDHLRRLEHGERSAAPHGCDLGVLGLRHLRGVVTSDVARRAEPGDAAPERSA